MSYECDVGLVDREVVNGPHTGAGEVDLPHVWKGPAEQLVPISIHDPTSRRLIIQTADLDLGEASSYPGELVETQHKESLKPEPVTIRNAEPTTESSFSKDRGVATGLPAGELEVGRRKAAEREFL